MVIKFKLYENNSDVFAKASLLTYFFLLHFCGFLTLFMTHNYQEFLDINTETSVHISMRPYLTFLPISDLISVLNSLLLDFVAP